MNQWKGRHSGEEAWRDEKLGEEDELSARVGRAGAGLEEGVSEPQVHNLGPPGWLKRFARLFHTWIFLSKNLWLHWILQ